MKSLKNIIAFFIFVVIVSCYMGHSGIDLSDLVTNKMEMTSDFTGQQKAGHPESSSEEAAYCHSEIIYLTIPSGSERCLARDRFFLPGVHYPIWLPPDNS